MTVLLLHALPLDERMWEPQRAVWPDAVTPRLYGRGNSMEAWARGILAEVTGDFAVVGASMGGYCALEIARQARERVRGLVLAGARVDADSPERREGRAKTIELIRARGAGGLWEDMRPKLFPAEASEGVEVARGLALEQRPDELVAAVEAIRDRRDSTEVVAGLQCPVLFAVGASDPFVSPPEAPPSAELRVFETGHLPSLERPDEFNTVLAEFLARV
ncbi:MAG TPA: alpha/beta hydrolase [Gaiellaceae bacterium]|nr:alpha/beta hydrolase [Gaiellaceae bacterium]